MNNSSKTLHIFINKYFHFFEYRLFTGAVFFGFVTCSIGTLVNLSLPVSPYLTLTTTLGIPFYLSLFFILRFSRQNYLNHVKWIASLFTFVLLDFLWFLNYGSYGPILYLILVFFTLLLLIWDGWKRTLLLIIFFLNITLLFYIEYRYPQLLGSYEKAGIRAVDLYSGFVIYVILAAILVNPVKQNYIKEREKAIASDRLKSTFLANMSHEIRTPMNAIMGFSQLMDNENLEPEKRKKYLSIIEENSTVLLQLIDDIIDISKIEAGQLSLSYSSFNINTLLSDFSDSFRVEIEKTGKKNLNFLNDIYINEPYVISDPVRIKQILTNLAGNALKFTKEGFIRIICSQNDDKLHFSVEDTGIGIPLDKQEIIFKRFIKLNSGDASVKGTGIGLAIVSDLINLLQGKIWLYSEPSKGSSFHFEIPYSKSELPETPDKPEVRDSASSFADKILVAEDEDHNFMVMEEFLSLMGLRAVRAVNGKEAVQSVKERNDIALVFMDLKMPVMGGLTATGKIKSLFPGLPVIALTAYAMEGDELKAREAGCDDYMAKPVRIEDVKDMLNRHLPAAGK